MRIYLSSFKPSVLEQFRAFFSFSDVKKEELNIMIAFEKKFIQKEYGKLPGINQVKFIDEDLRPLFNSLAIDSGAFPQAMRDRSREVISITSDAMDKNITFADYEEFLRDLRNNNALPDFFFDFDIIDDSPEAIKENKRRHNILKLNGFGEAVYVLHDPETEVDEIVNSDDYPMVGIGSNVLDDALPSVVSRIHDSFINGERRKVWLLGCTDFEILKRCPAAAGDSTTWAKDVGLTKYKDSDYGFIRYWNTEIDGEDKTSLIPLCPGLFKNLSGVEKDHINKYILRIQDNCRKWIFPQTKGSPDLFGNMFVKGADRLNLRHILSVYYYIELQREVSNLHRQAGFDTSWPEE